MRNPWLMRVGVLLLAGLAVSCHHEKQKGGVVLPPSRYSTLPAAKLPDYFKDSILERTVLANTGPLQVSSYGLVVNLPGTGENTVPTAVRDYIIKEMRKHHWDSPGTGWHLKQAEDILRDKRVAIVRVDGFIPPGARRGEQMDVYVSAIDTSYTSSLSGGTLYRSDLRLDGANPQNPGGSVNVYVRAQGAVFVNPAYALKKPGLSDNEAKASLRRGVVMNGGEILDNRPIHLRLRQPQFSMTRAIEMRIAQRYNSREVAAAADDGIVNVYVPADAHGDWQHFSQVVHHLFLNGSPEFSAIKARELAEAATAPNAPLLDISYAWEGLGEAALPFVIPLMNNPSPEVAFAAARAAAFIGDSSARQVLLEMARKKDHPFQVAAVQVLGGLTNSPQLNAQIAKLLECDQTMVRLEAYKILSRNQDASIYSKVVREKFVLDLVASGGKPLIYASRQGIPRIAVIGDRPAVRLPLLFNAMDNTLTITDSKGKYLSIFYRGPGFLQPVTVSSRPEIAEVIARLGGMGAPGEKTLDFTYSSIVAIVAALSDGKRIYAQSQGEEFATSFVLQEAAVVADEIRNAPPIPEAGSAELGAADNTSQYALGRLAYYMVKEDLS